MSLKLSCTEALLAPPPDMPQKPLVFVVAAAVIDRKKRILMAKRPEGKHLAGMWEFPGGKIEAGEIPEYALMRELREELGIETRPCGMWPIGFVSHAYPEFHLVMSLFAIRVWGGEPQSLEGQEFGWFSIPELYTLPMPDADKPLIPQLEALV